MILTLLLLINFQFDEDVPAIGGPTNDPMPSKIKRNPYATARFSSPKNSIKIDGKVGPATADRNPNITFAVITAGNNEYLLCTSFDNRYD